MIAPLLSFAIDDPGRIFPWDKSLDLHKKTNFMTVFLCGNTDESPRLCFVYNYIIFLSLIGFGNKMSCKGRRGRDGQY